MAENVTVRAEITAAVWKIVAQVGMHLAEGDPVLILESMKMEIPMVAPRAGTVSEILVREGQLVEEGQPVATLAA